MRPIVDVVVVTYNRLNKLQKALKSYDDQTVPFRNLILVNNCSTDGTSDFISRWKEIPAMYTKIVLNTSKNLGGSGGFYLGQKKALQLKADWVFLADDDAYPDSRMFEHFYNFIDEHNPENYSAVCSSVLTIDGNFCSGHRDRWTLKWGRFYRYEVPVKEYNEKYFSIDLLSYVGAFINCQAMRKEGTVNPNYFIYFDDSEHSFRLKKYGEIICLPSMVVVHDNQNSVKRKDNGIPWQEYYSIRNEFNMLLKHMPIMVSLRMIKRFIQYRGRDLCSDESYLKVYRTAVWHAIGGFLGINKHYSPNRSKQN